MNALGLPRHPYRAEPKKRIWQPTEEQLWEALDRALECALREPSMSYTIANMVWSDAKFYGYREVMSATSDLLAILAGQA